MKFSKKFIQSKAYKILRPQFEEQTLTSFAGIVVFQALFARLNIKQRFAACFQHLKTNPIFESSTIMLLLVIHILLGYRRLRDIQYYRDDPLVKRTLGLNQLPDVATVSRALSNVDGKSVENVRSISKQVVLERLQQERLPRVTLDFDGTVQSTKRRAEGSAVGYNKKKKGARSYYPLLCTIPQTSQVLDAYHRPGNVHDSNGAKEFISACIQEVRSHSASSIIESRMDSAFFNETIIDVLEQADVEFTISVPFARFAELKSLIEERKHWKNFNHELSYFESAWKPQCWDNRFRFIFIRTKVKMQHKEPIQLDLFTPYEEGYEFKVIVTNKTRHVKNALAFHNGRGAQENIIGELKSQGSMDYVPVKTLAGNQLFFFANIMAYNLNKELQMTGDKKQFGTTQKRHSLWQFKQLDTIRKNILQRAGRLIRPQGKLTLSMSTNNAVEKELLHYFDSLVQAT
jgi:hypothetical protein